jgi:outer membrane protein assembly factor BamD
MRLLYQNGRKRIPGTDNAKDAVELREKLQKESEAFAKLQKEVEARRAELTEKQKQAEAKLRERTSKKTNKR